MNGKILKSYDLMLFKFQYDNTLRTSDSQNNILNYSFKFQYDNTLSITAFFLALKLEHKFKFQYDNTLS